MRQINRRSYGKSNSSAVDENSLCVPTLDYPVSGMVRFNPEKRSHDTLTMKIYFPENENEKRAPITVKFEIPYFTVSGIQVRYLKIVEKSGYQALPWVRYITQHGDDYRYIDLPIKSSHRRLTFIEACGLRLKKAALQWPLCE